MAYILLGNANRRCALITSMPTTITDLTVRDIRFPTSRALDGSDAMNPAPDYSATYVILKTNASEGLVGHGLTFTIGRGNEISVAAVKSLREVSAAVARLLRPESVVAASISHILSKRAGRGYSPPSLFFRLGVDCLAAKVHAIERAVHRAANDRARGRDSGAGDGGLLGSAGPRNV